MFFLRVKDSFVNLSFLRQVIGAVGFKFKLPILAKGCKVMESLVSDTNTLKPPLPRIFCQNWDSFGCSARILGKILSSPSKVDIYRFLTLC